jgi:hypothetical protein
MSGGPNLTNSPELYFLTSLNSQSMVPIAASTSGISESRGDIHRLAVPASTQFVRGYNRIYGRRSCCGPRLRREEVQHPPRHFARSCNHKAESLQISTNVYWYRNQTKVDELKLLSRLMPRIKLRLDQLDTTRRDFRALRGIVPPPT